MTSSELVAVEYPGPRTLKSLSSDLILLAHALIHSTTASVCQQEPREAEESQRGSERTYLRWQV